jgi:hypothetical protein
VKEEFPAMKTRFLLAAAVLPLLAVSFTAEAQGIVGGAQEGARVGSRAAGPVGGAVGAVGGGVVGGVVGGVKGVLGVPQRGVRRASYYRKSARARRARRAAHR